MARVAAWYPASAAAFSAEGQATDVRSQFFTLAFLSFNTLPRHVAACQASPSTFLACFPLFSPCLPQIGMHRSDISLYIGPLKTHGTAMISVSPSIHMHTLVGMCLCVKWTVKDNVVDGTKYSPRNTLLMLAFSHVFLSLDAGVMLSWSPSNASVHFHADAGSLLALTCACCS